MASSSKSLTPVILSGGIGSRLWPISREEYPKQLLSLIGKDTMIQQTAERIKDYASASAPLVICNEAHRFIIAEQLREKEIEPVAIMLEPVGRNTAPATAIAALKIIAQNPDGVMLILPADHIIRDVNAFHRAIDCAMKAANKGYLVTFGITPDKPETGYGYIKQADRLENIDGAYKIEHFVEKPDTNTAEHYLQDGGYFWNSGMFVFKAQTYLDALTQFEPEIISACKSALLESMEDLDFLRLEKEAFMKSPSISIDYAVMEKTDKAVIVPVEMGWSDVGSWSALWELSDKNRDDNVCVGDVLTHHATGNYVRNDSMLTALVGVDNIVVVVTDDAVLVADKHQVQDVKYIVNQLKTQERPERMNHRKVYRPWGYYDSLFNGTRAQVKELSIKPGAKLSLQKHFHRAEHWVVISGTALVTRDDDQFELSENESVFIPRGAVHRIENPGKVPLKIIEVQSGEYLGEDDIVRIEDDFGRTKQAG